MMDVFYIVAATVGISYLLLTAAKLLVWFDKLDKRIAELERRKKESND